MEKYLFDNILEKLSTDNCPLEDIGSIEFNGVRYCCAVIEKLTTEDEGKYQLGGNIYGVGEFNEQQGYGIIEPLFFVEQDFTQTGSYYSYQEREYEKPYRVEKQEKKITFWNIIK